MILIVAPNTNEHARTVVPALLRRGAAVTWMDLAELPAGGALTATFRTGAPAGATLQIRGQTVDLRTVTAVWAPRLRAPQPDPRLANDDVSEYVSRETADTWHGVMALSDCLWVPAPHWDELRALSKPLQLAVAAELGFEIPPTLITNSPAALLEFHRAQPTPLISKTVHNRLLPVDARRGYTAYAVTETIANRDLGHMDAIQPCPVTFQPYVDKQVELRVTIVGERVFSAAIDSQWTNHTRRDWRRGDPYHQRFAAHELPERVAEQAVALARRLRLNLAALDLILTPDGRYVFLEINPNGGWYWIQLTTGLPIGEAIADLLMTGAAAKPTAAATLEPPPDLPSPVIPPRFPSSRRAAVQLPRRTATAVVSTVAWLTRQVNAGTTPAEALPAFRRFRARHRGIQMDLVWDFETYAGTFHYDVLARIPGGRLSIAISPDRGVPWALRHAHHARESDLVRVNGRALSVQTVMGYIGGLWQNGALVTDVVDGCLMREAVDARGLSATDAEVDAALVAFTQAQRLTRTTTKAEWLRRRGWTDDDLRFEVRRMVIAQKLRDAIAGDRVQEWFDRHHATLDLAAVARLRLTDAGAARRLARQLRGRRTAASDAVEAAVLDGNVLAATYGVEIVRRRDLGDEAARFVFAAAPGEIGGPFAADNGFDVIRVLRTSPATLDDDTRGLVVDRLFQDWLEQQRQHADVEWFWGDVERAPRRERRP